jgi:hypothetical protein
MSERATVVGRRMWKRLGLAFFVMAGGLGLSLLGLAWDFYEHEIAGAPPELESILAPPHLAIFGGIAITALGFLIGDLALRKEGWYPLKMVTA